MQTKSVVTEFNIVASRNGALQRKACGTDRGFLAISTMGNSLAQEGGNVH